MIPSTPRTTNEKCQLTSAIRPVTTGSESTVPTREPESITALANARSCAGNQRDAALVALGYAGASPAPSANRNANSDQNPRASGVSAVTMLHHNAANVNALRDPTLSANQPAASIAPSYAQKNAPRIRPFSALLSSRCRSSWMNGSATLRFARSR
ncbi:hypothetical protein PWY36_27725 [Kribbella solani]|nr:hypothetical protein [Kribbella solani]